MIQASLHSLQRKAWQSELADAIRDPAELLELLQLPRSLLADTQGPAEQFPLKVPRSYVARMKPGDHDDPLLRQVLPIGEEMHSLAGFVADPVGDLQAMPVPGLLHKYQGRALLVTTGACAVHCRYCFRRHFPYSSANPATSDWQPALDYLCQDASINEIILSGGDPLSLSDQRLAGLVQELAAIPHLHRLRIHTRLPVVLPHRVNEELSEWLKAVPMKTVIVLHINHANELNDELALACNRLKQTGTTLLNQSVLLKGVNDDVDSLTRLSEALFNNGVLPYYLHQLDPVKGAGHFDVADEKARHLHKALREQLPGYLVPRLVRENPGMAAKSPL